MRGGTRNGQPGAGAEKAEPAALLQSEGGVEPETPDACQFRCGWTADLRGDGLQFLRQPAHVGIQWVLARYGHSGSYDGRLKMADMIVTL